MLSLCSHLKQYSCFCILVSPLNFKLLAGRSPVSTDSQRPRQHISKAPMIQTSKDCQFQSLKKPLHGSFHPLNAHWQRIITLRATTVSALNVLSLWIFIITLLAKESLYPHFTEKLITCPRIPSSSRGTTQKPSSGSLKPMLSTTLTWLENIWCAAHSFHAHSHKLTYSSPREHLHTW